MIEHSLIYTEAVLERSLESAYIVIPIRKPTIEQMTKIFKNILPTNLPTAEKLST